MATLSRYLVYSAVLYGLESLDLSLNTNETDIDSKKDEGKRLNTSDVYAPDRPLPQKGGEKIPDTDAPHTQLGTRSGRKGKYPQAREFDKDGKPVRDVDFTDHGRAHNHPCPHQHEWKKNPTGGSLKRNKKPNTLPNWDYEK